MVGGGGGGLVSYPDPNVRNAYSLTSRVHAVLF